MVPKSIVQVTGINAIALFSSSRRNGNTGKFIDHIASQTDMEIVDLSTRAISFFDYDHKNRNDDFEPLMDHVLGYDKILFVSPEYWYTVSSPMKIFLDRISDYLDIPELLNKGRALRGKTAWVVSTSISDEPSSPFLDCFKMTFDYLGMNYGGYIHANCLHGYAPEEHESKIKAFISDFYADGLANGTP